MGRLTLLGSGQAVASGFSPTSTESSNFLARTSGLNDLHKTRYDALITGLVTDGDYTKLDILYIWATDTTTNALLNLCPFPAYNGTIIGTPASFTTDVGYTGNGSSFAIDSGFNPNSASSPKYTLDNASVGLYVQTNDTSASVGIAFCATGAGGSGGGDMWVNPNYFGNTVWRVNFSGSRSIAASTTQGLWIATRTASNAVALYRNGSTTVDSGTDTSVDVPHVNIYFFAQDSGGSASNFCSLQMSAGFVGSGLTSAAMARIAGRINTYMTAYSINVY